ncbi:hypothetical protein BC833DRAFT_626813, partial [Globomyces pollinis-pini]
MDTDSSLLDSASVNRRFEEESKSIKKQKFNPAKWKEEQPIIYSVDKGNMFFVNRSDAMIQLHKIHKAKYERATSSGVGADWIIPIADNVVGLGKSAFGQHYIQKSRELWKDVENKTKFQKNLSECHTVHITFRKGALLEGSFDLITMQYLIEALTPLFEHGPCVLQSAPPTVDRFLINLTKEVGPVFIVLDEIGDAFQNGELNDIQQREKFIRFCNFIVGKWLSVPAVFFVILGRGSFLGYVDLRPVNLQLTSSNFKFKRLNIHLLRANAIELILKNTRLVENDEKSVKQHHDLSDEQCSEVAAALF